MPRKLGTLADASMRRRAHASRRRVARPARLRSFGTTARSVACPAGLEPATPGLEVLREEATGGSGKPLPLILWASSHTRDNSKLRRAATHCQSFVSRLSPRVSNAPSRESHAPRFNDYERIGDPIAELGHNIHHRLTEHASRFCGEANQNNSSGLLVIRVSELAEVLVFSEKHARFRACQREDGIVVSARIDFRDCGDVVTCSAESRDDTKVTALVGEELHSLLATVVGAFADENDFFVSDGISGVPDRRMDVVTRESWISVEQIGFRRTFAEFAKDQFNWNARSADHRLSKHHPRIDLDALCQCHCDQNTPETGLELASSELENGSNVLVLEIGIVGQDLLPRGAGGKDVEHVLHADTESANAGPTTAHIRRHRDSVYRAHMLSAGLLAADEAIVAPAALESASPPAGRNRRTVDGF